MNKHLCWQLTVACLLLLRFAAAQTNDLMIVEYIDSDPGAGFGITIYNPTSRPVNLGNYKVGTYNNGSTSGTEVSLSGMIQPGGYTKVGNTSFCNTNCSGTCNTTSTSAGVNGNDAVVLKGANGQPVDMVGLYGVDVFNMVGGVSRALLHHHLYREPTNCIRYSSTDGTSANSWPNTSAENVTGWRVEGVTGSEACLKANFSFSASVAVKLPRDTSICDGARVTLRAIPPSGLDYQWSTGSTGNSITVDTSGTFILTASRNGCLSRDTVKVQVRPLPTVHFDSGDTSMCVGDSIRLSVADSAGWHYQWSTMDTITSIVVSDSGYYTLNVNHNSCRTSDSIHVALRRLPIFSLGNDTGYCRNDTLQLSLRHLPGRHYKWNTADTTFWVEVMIPGEYSLQVMENGCVYSDTIVVSEHPLPRVRLGADQMVCGGQSAALSATIDLDSVRYRWNTGDTTRTMQAHAGTYWLQAVTQFGCSGHDTVQVAEEAPVTFGIGSDRVMCLGSTLTLTPDTAFFSYRWNNGDTTRTLLVDGPGTHNLTGISQLGCESPSPSVSVMQVPCNFTIPNVFTPGQDAVNSTWKPAEPFLIKADVKVFNRWGKQVFASSEANFEWTGADATAGMYFFLIEGTTFEQKSFSQKGWIELVR